MLSDISFNMFYFSFTKAFIFSFSIVKIPLTKQYKNSTQYFLRNKNEKETAFMPTNRIQQSIF